MAATDPITTITHELGIDEADIARRKSFLEFTEADVALLKQLHALLEAPGSIDEFIRVFYDHLLAYPEMRALIPDEATLERLKKSQSAYFNGLTTGDYGDEYVRQRLHVGAVHQHVGLDPKWYIGAYRKYLSHLHPLLWRLYGDDSEKFIAAYGALLKIVLFDMGLAIDTYAYADKQAVQRLEQRLHQLLDGIDAIVWDADADMRFSFVSHKAVKMLGYPLERWTQEPDFWRNLILPEDRERVVSLCSKAVAEVGDHEMEYRVQAVDGRIIWVHERVTVVRGEDGKVTGLRGLLVDISAIKETENKLVHLASHDELTGLPNRTLLQDRMRQAMAHASRGSDLVAIMFIDLDRFKNINDSLGHEIGDAVLRAAAERLTGSVREVDTVSRLGGDEFVIMLIDIERTEDITVVAKKVLEALAQPFKVDMHEFFLTASIGISVYPKDGTDVQTLLKGADTAMYRAKEGGKNRFEFFTDTMNVSAVRRLNLENQLRQALERNEFVLHYQPQADLETGRIIGVEALIRWAHPEMGMISPMEFIPIAEETGFIVPLGEWVLETACRQAVAWQTADLPRLRMAVNLSVRQFVQSDLAGTIAP